MNFRLVLLLALACLPLQLFAQEETTTIYGKITDSEGKPIFPASIAVAGTAQRDCL